MFSEPSALNKTVLAVDDDASILALIRMLLQERVKKIWTSENPHEGLRLALMYKPDLILLDNQMDGLDGTAVLQQLREMPSTQHIPVIMLTADNRLETVQQAAKYAAQAYLLKPFDPELVWQKVSHCLGLAAEPQRVELPPLSLSAEQWQALALRGPLNVLAVIKHELKLLATALDNPNATAPALAALKPLQAALGDTVSLQQALQQLDACEQALLDNLASLRQAHLPSQGPVPFALYQQNLQTLLALFAQRTQAYLARVSDPWCWVRVSSEQLRQALGTSLESLPRNSLHRYQAHYALPQLTPADPMLELVSAAESEWVLPAVLLEVLRELAGNSRLYSPPDSPIRCEIQQLPEAAALHFRLRDSGWGMTPAEQEQVLGWGQRGSQGLERHPHGSGLGLTQAGAVIQALGGQIWLASAPHWGTEVSFRLPVPAAALPDPAAPAPAQ